MSLDNKVEPITYNDLSNHRARLSRFATGTLYTLLGLGAMLYGAKKAEATPIMEADATQSIDDYWPDRPGLESLWTITVTNTSDVGQQNDMFDFTYESGFWTEHGFDDITEEGVFYVEPGNGWSMFESNYSTVFNGLLEPGASVQHFVYTTQLGTAKAYATARARGPPQGLTFEPVQVDVPAPEPATLGFMATGALAMLLYRKRENR